MREKCDLANSVRCFVEISYFSKQHFPLFWTLNAAHLDFALFIEDLHHKRDSFGYNKGKSSAGYGLAEKIKMSVAIWLGSAPFRDFLKKKGSKRRLTHDLLNPTHFDQPQY